MVHPLVEQLKFTRSEVVRAMEGVTDDEAVQRFLPMNCLSWMVGHLADQEQRFWLTFQGLPPVAPGLNAQVGNGRPASTPPLAEMWAAWHAVGSATEAFLNGLTGDDLLRSPAGVARARDETIGTMLLRTIYHQWFHIGESQAIRQLQAALNRGDFVGSLGEKAPYRPAD